MQVNHLRDISDPRVMNSLLGEHCLLSFPLCGLTTNFLITFQTCLDSSIGVGRYRLLLSCSSAHQHSIWASCCCSQALLKSRYYNELHQLRFESFVDLLLALFGMQRPHSAQVLGCINLFLEYTVHRSWVNIASKYCRHSDKPLSAKWLHNMSQALLNE